MNAVMTYATTSDQAQRYDTIRRRNAENAYERNVQYNGQNQKMVEELVASLVGKKEPENVQPEREKFKKLDAGQMKQMVFPIGNTLERTIELWRDVRAEAVTKPEPTTADYQLAATATSKIMQTETQIALRKIEQSEIETAVERKKEAYAKVVSVDFSADVDRDAVFKQRRFEKAISTYSIQKEAKQNGFEFDLPSFYKVA